MALNLPARAAEHVLKSLGVDCRQLAGPGLLINGKDAGAITVFFRWVGGQLPQALLEGPALVALCGPGRLDLYQSCPWLKGKVARWKFETFLTEALKSLRTSATLRTDQPSRCDVPCVFEDQLRTAIGQLRHERFGLFITFGIGRRAREGKASEDDLLALREYLGRDLDALRSSQVDCRFLRAREHLFFRVLAEFEELATAAQGGADAARRIGELMGRLETRLKGG